MADGHVARELLRSRGSLFAFALTLVRDFDLAEELFQEASVRVLEREGQYTPGTDFGSWARAFVRRTAFELYRAKGRIVLSQEAVDAVEAKFACEADDSSTDKRKALRECMSKVDHNAKKMISLRYTLGRSMAQIGKELARSAGAVQVALSRTRRWLRDCMKRRMAGEGAA
jgi:RNA polymerase sigma-70 factor (ECF subfamily)